MPYGKRRSRARRIVESTSRKASGWRRMEAIVVKIKLRLRGETKWPYLRRASLARTSPQDLAADGLRACTRRRLASSLRCASVTGMASGVATRLSQSSSISSSRSSTLSERACLSTVLMFAFSAGRPQAARIMSRITLRVSGGAVEHGTWRPRDHAVRSSRMLAGLLAARKIRRKQRARRVHSKGR